MARRTANLDAWRAAINALPTEVKDAARAALDKSTTNALNLLKRNIPKGDTGDLLASARKRPGPTELSYIISVGGPTAPYAPYVEFGHQDSDQHVPPQPFFFPAMRVSRKRVTGAVMGAVRKVYKEMQGVGK